MTRRILSVLAAASLATAASAAPAVAHGGDGDDLGASAAKGKGAQVQVVDLDALNGSGVAGRAVLVLRGDELRVNITARGLEAGALHPQHIHGLMGSEEAVCPPPSAADDLAGLPEEADDPDEFISLEEGAPFYGPILLPLTPFPTANKAGVTTYSQSFEVDGDLLDLSDEVIVLHGMTIDGTYVATLPVACGNIG